MTKYKITMTYEAEVENTWIVEANSEEEALDDVFEVGEDLGLTDIYFNTLLETNIEEYDE